jgi:hypothetical protein
MAIFRTDELVTFAQTLPKVGRVRVRDSGGDVDTKSVAISVQSTGNSFSVCGFSTGNACLSEVFGFSPDNCEVEMVEVTDGKDSRGGWNSGLADDGAVYVAIVSWLTERGHHVVPRLKDYF